MSGRASTGVRRLDEMLEGGLLRGSATLVHGPPFAGKELLARRFLLAGCARGEPGVLVLTNAEASDAARDLAGIDPRFPSYAEQGLVQFVDAYTLAIAGDGKDQGDGATANASYVDGPMDLNGLIAAVAQAQRRAAQHGPSHRVAFDSLSTLLGYTNAQTAFRFLQVFIGRARRAGATALYLLEHGMHADAEVQMLKHLVDGVIECRSGDGTLTLMVQGAGAGEHRGWVEYRFTGGDIDLVGSFASGRIK